MINTNLNQFCYIWKKKLCLTSNRHEWITYNNACSTLFWSDRWLMGCSLEEIALTVVAAIPHMSHCSRSFTSSWLASRHQRRTLFDLFVWIFSIVGYPPGDNTNLGCRCPPLEARSIRSFFIQVFLSGLFYWFNYFRALASSLEIMGSSEMQTFPLVGNKE
jgi:hypothetical protein